MQLIDYIIMVVAVFLITLVSVQTSSDDATSAFSGEKSELFADRKERGAEVWMTRFTAFIALLFLGLVFYATFYVTRSILV